MIGHPSGDTDVQVKLEAALEQALVPGETMQHGCREMRPILFHDGEEIGLGIALVKKGWTSQSGGEFELCREGMTLNGTRREVTEIIQARFPDGSRRGRLRQGLQQRGAVL